jgi:nucleotide-binding universal stress UspA family protein
MKVLFATDGSDASHRAGELLAGLADPGRTEIVVLSVNDFEVALREASAHHGYSSERSHAAANQAAEAAADALREAGFGDVRVRVVEGDGATEIVAQAEQAELVVVGSGKEGWLDTIVLGSVSSSVLHASPCPVLVVHRAPSGDGPVRVVVGTDGSEGSSHAIAALVGLADPARCEVAVVAAARPVALPPGGAEGGEAVAGEVADAEQEAATRHLAAASEVLTAAGFRVETQVVHGGAAPAILDQVASRDAHLAVVGARGLGRFRAKVLGSVSDRVIRHAPATLVGR